MSEKQSYELTLEADFTDPVFAPAAFQVLRQAAALHGLPNLGWTRIHMTVEVDGSAYPQQIDDLKSHLEALWFGGVREVKVRPKREAAE